MKLHGKKALACISLVLLVLSIIPSGALSNETGTQNATDAAAFADGRSKGKGPMERPGMEMPQFETEEEKMAFLKERAIESVQKRIEMTEKMLGNIDETDNGNVTAESLEKEIGELEALLEQINSATSLEELKELMSESMKMGEGKKMRDKGSGMEIPEFETEEEEFGFLKEMMTTSTEMRIERTTSMIENMGEVNDEKVTAESLKEELSKLEALLEDINDTTTLEELRELMPENMKMGRGNEMQGKGPGRGMPSFETEEEEFEFAKTRTLESVERMIEALENTTLEETDSDNTNSEDVEALLVQLEDIKTKLSSEDLTLEDLKDIRENISGIMDSIREMLPVPANERGHAPGPHGSQGEATA